jgi:hypothetical protein
MILYEKGVQVFDSAGFIMYALEQGSSEPGIDKYGWQRT